MVEADDALGSIPDVEQPRVVVSDAVAPVEAAALGGLGIGRTNEFTTTDEPVTRAFSAAVAMTASTESLELAVHAASARRFASRREALRQLGWVMYAFTNSS